MYVSIQKNQKFKDFLKNLDDQELYYIAQYTNKAFLVQREIEIRESIHLEVGDCFMYCTDNSIESKIYVLYKVTSKNHNQITYEEITCSENNTIIKTNIIDVSLPFTKYLKKIDRSLYEIIRKEVLSCLQYEETRRKYIMEIMKRW
jgi:hypothetical protein